MNNKYDSILKEKKKYETIIDDRPFIRKHLLFINILATILIITISFIIYFNTILTPINIIYDDIIEIIDSYKIVYEKLLPNIKDQNNLSSTMDISIDSNYPNTEELSFLNGIKFDYSLINNKDNKLFTIKSPNYNLKYYQTTNNTYLDYDNSNIIYERKNNNYNPYQNILKTAQELLLTELKMEKISKDVYIDNNKPIVAIDFELSGKQLNDMYSNLVSNLDITTQNISQQLKKEKIMSDNVKLMFSIKNDLFKNEITNIKIVIKDNDYRAVLTYRDNTLTIKDDIHEYKIVLKKEENDFSLIFYTEDVIKSVLSGKENDSSYIYSYQVINVINNTTLQISHSSNNSEYILNIKKEKDDNYLYLDLVTKIEYNNNTDIDNTYIKNNQYTPYNELDPKQKKEITDYVYKIYNIFYNILNFVK